MLKHEYKERVRRETRGNDYKKFAVSRNEFNTVILQNIKKAKMITGDNGTDLQILPSTEQILSVQISEYETRDYMHVICTCVFYIAEYNANFLIQE